MGGFADLITNAISVAKGLTDSLQVEIVHRACTGYSGSARSYSATSNTFKVLLEHKEKMVRSEDGSQQLSKTQISFLEPLNLTMEDEITLPDGSKPQIMAIEGLMNPSKVMYNPTVYF